MKNDLILRKVVLIAMFSALACAGTFIQIRMPAGDFVHLGNFVMIVSALLLGGLAGGLSGSLGMGLYDLIFYTSKPSTILRTFVLKFIVGFLVGFIFRLIIKKELPSKKILFVLSGFFTIVGVVFIILFVNGDKSSFGFDNGLSSVYSNIFGTKNSFKISLYIPIFSFLFGIATIVAAILSHKLSKRSMAALVAVSIAIFINIIGEFVLRWLLEGLMVSDFNTSIVVATSKIPGSFITGFISVILSVLIYEPIYRAISHAGFIEDNTNQEENINATVEVTNSENR